AQQLLQTQPTSVSHFQQCAVPARARRIEEALHFLGTEHARQYPWPFGKRQMHNHVGPTQRDVVKKTQSAHRLIERAPGDLAGDEMLLVRTQLLPAELFG